MNREKEYDIMLKGLLKESVPYIAPEELNSLDSPYVLLDTRSPREYEVSHIRNAEFISYDEFSFEAVSGLPRDTLIVVYCSVGYRSEKIGEKLKEEGFTNVLNLYGGIFEWKNEGFEVVNLKQQVTDSIHTYNKSWSRWMLNGTKIYD
jgi:rhodanese-related sulfurtransferase